MDRKASKEKGGYERVKDQLSQPNVAPCAMNEEKFFEEPKLGDSDVGGASGLEALDAADPDADVGRLDHAHIICPISNR